MYGENNLRQLWASDSAEAVGALSIDGEGVAVSLIHHLVDVTVAVIPEDIASGLLVFTITSLGRAALRAKEVKAHRIRKIKPDRINMLELNLSRRNLAGFCASLARYCIH